MRELSELIDEVRFNTNNDVDSRFSDARLIKFFNSAQRAIQKIIYNSNPSNSIFDKTQTYSLSGNGPYDLPEDIYAVSAIKSLQPSSGTTLAKPLPFLDSREKHSTFGYYVMGSQFFLAPTTISNSFDSAILTYTKKLEDMTSVSDTPELPSVCEDYLMLWVERKIQSVDSSSDLTVTAAFSELERKDIEDLFKNHQRDVKTPVIVDSGYFSY